MVLNNKHHHISCYDDDFENKCYLMSCYNHVFLNVNVNVYHAMVIFLKKKRHCTSCLSDDFCIETSTYIMLQCVF